VPNQNFGFLIACTTKGGVCIYLTVKSSEEVQVSDAKNRS